MKLDLTKYSDKELSLLVFNTEEFYEGRHWPGFFEQLEARFLYTPAQFEILCQDLKADLEELKMMQTPIEKLKYHVTGAIERGETTAIEAVVETKHTPGPWRYERAETINGGNIWDANNEQVVCDTDRAICNDANAKLIAAAPDLLAALERQLVWLKDIQVLYRSSDDLQDELKTEIKCVEIAIAKARGES